MTFDEWYKSAKIFPPGTRAQMKMAFEAGGDREAARYRWLARMWPLEITRLVHNHHASGPTSTEIGDAIDAAMRHDEVQQP